MSMPRAGLRFALLAAGLVLVYLALWAHDPRWDLTTQRINTLKPQTVTALDGLEQNLRLTLFEQDGQSQAGDLLERCRRVNSRFSFRIIDPARCPGLAERYGVSGYGQAVLEQGGRRLVLESLDEPTLLSGLQRLADFKPHLVCFSRGHAERRLSDSGRGGLQRLRETLSAQGFDLREINLESESLPTDTSVLVIAGPRQAFGQPAGAALTRYLAAGGAALIGLDPGYTDGLDKLLADYGIAAPDNLVLDPVSRIYGGDDSVPVVNSYGGLPELKGFKYATFFARARALEIAPVAGFDLKPLALTATTSWAERDIAGFGQGDRCAKDAGETGGPLKLALYARDPQTKARLIVFGDSDFMSNAYLAVSGNRLLLLTCLNTLGTPAGLSAPAPNGLQTPPFVLSANQTRLVFWLAVVLLPGLALLGLITVVLVRRRA